MTRILIVEDEPRIASALSQGLVSQGFSPLVVDNGESAIALAKDSDFDLMLLDLGLPDQSGLMVLRTVRDLGATLPIIILTVYDDLRHKVHGLNSGADDYVTKPFQLAELIARIQVQLRKKTALPAPEDLVFTVGELQLDLRHRQVKRSGKVVELSTREFILLEMLMRRHGEAVSRVDLMNEVWGYDYDTASNVVDVYVGYLRKKLGAHLIETVRGIGYRFRG